MLQSATIEDLIEVTKEKIRNIDPNEETIENIQYLMDEFKAIYLYIALIWVEMSTIEDAENQEENEEENEDENLEKADE